MTNLWSYILNATIYGSITGIAILILTKLLKNKINRKYAYLLWMILVIKIIVPFGPQSSISLFNKIPINIKSNSSISETTNIDVSQSYLVDNNYEDNSRENISKENTSTSTDNDTIYKIENKKVRFDKIIPYIWISGAIITLFTYLIVYLYFVINLGKKDKSTYMYLERILNSCKEKLKIKRKIRIVIDDTINSPSLIGNFKTTIILPRNLIHLSEEELTYIFLHELCHYKFKDNMVDTLLMFLQSLHWFNPLIWYLFKQIRNDMEMACDERVLNILNEKEHSKYGLTMLTILEKVNFNKKLSVGLNMADDKKTIKKRVELIKNSKNFLKKKKIFTVTGIICLMIAGVVLLTNGHQKDKNINGSFSFDRKASENLDDAISEVIIEKYLQGIGGEYPVERHEILGKVENENYVEVYLMITYGVYEFQNDVFNLMTSISNTPMKMKFSKNKEGEKLKYNTKYYYVNSEMPQDGEEFKKSLYNIFPKKEAEEAFKKSTNEAYAKELLEGINEDAKSYVNGLERNSKVTYNYAPKKALSDVALQNMSGVAELYQYPQYIGNREVLINNKRFIYETGYNERTGILSFYKYKENKKDEANIIQYKVNKDNIEKIDINNFVLYSKANAPALIDEDSFKITINSISVMDDKAEYYVSILNKSKERLNIKLDNINIGSSNKNVNFNVQLKPNETIYDNLIIEDVSDIGTLNDKIHGTLLVNSKEYNFIFK